MQVHRALPSRSFLDQCALTIGTFDGVHLGHQLLIERLKAEADARGLQAVALTFDDMPICLLRPDVCPALITLADEKIAAFAASKTPPDHLFVVPFTRAIASQSARGWMQNWVETIGLKLFVGGPDFALGRDREGSIAALTQLGQEFGFETLALQGKLKEGDAPISSTRSRDLIERGEVEQTPAFLGRFYRLQGRVIPGQQLGRTIGYPTINIEPHPRKCLPRNGVYAVRAMWNQHVFNAALNIGVRPTVNENKNKNKASSQLRRHIEFHVLGHNIETAPEKVEIEFIARLRDETKFQHLSELQTQLEIDATQAQQLLLP